MKKIIVFGAAGRTGRKITEYALEAGYAVTAFVHNNAAGLNHPSLKVVKGDVHDKEKVFSAIQGHDIVISAIGTNNIDTDAVNIMSDAMKYFVEAMKQFNIQKVFAVGGLAVLQHDGKMQLLDKPDYPAAYINVGEGHNKVYKVLRETDLNWTMICCPDIVDGPRTGQYSVKKDYKPRGLFQIFTGDIADFIIREIEDNNYPSTRVGISNY